MNKLSEGTDRSNGDLDRSKKKNDCGSSSEKARLAQGTKSVKAYSVSVPQTSGPRTSPGKERSKHNATRHGIFSSVVVLENESRKDYDVLLNGLCHSLQPVGEIEEILVEKLASFSWRQRRLHIAEGAEIRRNQEFVEWDRKQRQELEAEEQARRTTERIEIIEDDASVEYAPAEGLIWKTGNLEILDRCLEMLDELRTGFKGEGFSYEGADSILETIYGESGRGHLHETLFDVYEVWSRTAKATEEGRESDEYASPKQCKSNVAHAIDDEIAQLERLKETAVKIESARIELGKLRQGVPDTPALDRLLRYEVTLERAFDRTLSQLERLQRMRKGQPVLPPVKLEVSRT